VQKNTDRWHARKEDLQHATPLDILMVPSSSIAITTDGEHLACGGFSLGEPVRLGNFEFITEYFCGQSLSPMRGNEGAIFVGSTHSGASTTQRATIEDSTEEFSLRRAGKKLWPPFRQVVQHGGPVHPTATATWKENAPATTRFPSRTVEPWPETNHPSEQHHIEHKGQLMQTRARHPTTDPRTASR
jgi:hypothetical protein